MDGDEGPTPEAAYGSTPRSPCPRPAESRLDASRKDVLRGGACGPPSPTGRRSCGAGKTDLRLRREERGEVALFRGRLSASLVAVEAAPKSASASSSCSRLIACLSPERCEAKEREVGSRDGVIVDVEAILCCENDGGGAVEGIDELDCDFSKRAEVAEEEVELEGRPVVTEAEIGLSAAEL